MKQLRTSREMYYVNILVILFSIGMLIYVFLHQNYLLLFNIIPTLVLYYFLNRRYRIDHEKIVVQNGCWDAVCLKKEIPLGSILQVDVARKHSGDVKSLTIRYLKNGYRSWTTINDTDLKSLLHLLEKSIPEKIAV
ncbi:MAG: hypothetical protein RR202_08825 [Bacteroidales bacterium]